MPQYDIRQPRRTATEICIKLKQYKEYAHNCNGIVSMHKCKKKCYTIFKLCLDSSSICSNEIISQSGGDDDDSRDGGGSGGGGHPPVTKYARY